MKVHRCFFLAANIVILVAVMGLCQSVRANTLTVGGIGVELKMTGKGAVVEKVLPGGTAEAAGLTQGAILLEINGESTRGLSLSDIRSRLPGPPNTVVRLKVRKSGGKVMDVDVTRRPISVSGRPLYNGGYKWVKGVIKEVGPYWQIKDIVDRAKKTELEAYDPESFVDWIQGEFDKLPPTYRRGKRDVLFKALDVAAAMSASQRYEPLARYWRDATNVTAEQLKSPAAPGRLTIHKLYNEGVILRTPDVCAGIDIFLPPQLPPQVVEVLADKLDGLLITHKHGDHVALDLIKALRKKGKPIVVAEENTKVPIGEKLDAGSIGAAKWTSFRGRHMNSVFSGFYGIEVGKWRVIHSGDNAAWPPAFVDSDYAKHVDVFFVKLEEEAPDAVAKMGPRYFVPHHLLELGHGLGTYSHDALGLRKSQADSKRSRRLMLHWGDKYQIKPAL